MITLIEYVKQFFKNSPVIDVTSDTPPRHTHKYGNILDKMTLKNVITNTRKIMLIL